MPKTGFFAHPINYINRYRKIGAVLIKYGFEDVLSSIKASRHLPFIKNQRKAKKARKEADLQQLTRYERIRMVLEELGPTFIKFGQIMSNRPDLLPGELIVELEKLQDKVPAFEAEEAKAIIEEELGASTDNLFQKFEAEPFSSASIAQVHYAELNDGEPVVIKVQRPHIQSTVRTDIEIMRDLASLMDKHVASLRVFDPVGQVETFEKTIKKEMNFNLEASYVERFQHQFKDEPKLKAPRAFKKFTSNKVITLEYIEGIKISQTGKLEEAGYDLELLAKRGYGFYLTQIFEHGFFHADPHPGNVLVQEGHIIAFIDFGMMGFITEEDRENLVTMLIGINNNDSVMMIRVLEALSGRDDLHDQKGLAYEISEFLNEYAYQSLQDTNMQEIIERVRQIITRYEIKIHPDLFILMKALITIEGVGYSLDPQFNPFEEMKPHVKKMQRERLNPLKLMKDLYLSTHEVGRFLKDLPYDIKDLIEQAKAGKINVDIEHKGIEPFLATFNKVSNRIAFAILVASLVIGSSLLVHSKIPPVYQGVPIFGIIGFFIAGFLAIGLLISIIRHRQF